MSSYGWHSPLASSLPYMNSFSDSYSDRGVIMSMGMSPVPYDDMNEQFPFEEEMASSTEYIETESVSPTASIERHIKTSLSSTEHHPKSSSSTGHHIKQSSITSTTSSNDSDAEIDEIQRAIDKTLGSKEHDTPQHINPRAKYLAQLGIGKKLPIAQIINKSSTSQTSSRITPRTPPTSPAGDSGDDSLDAMLALMGVSDEMTTTPHMVRSSPIDIPRRVLRPIPIPTRHARRMTRPVMPMIPHTSHKYDSDDDTESYFDSPQSEDLSGSMLFDY